MNKSKIIRIMRVWMMLSFTAVIADLFYIIRRAVQPVTCIEDASFVWALPDMLGHMLLCTAIIAGFMAVSAKVFADSE